MSSFYGGKQGRTYNIVARYDNVRQMVESFNLGGSYTEANYGQYVLIDTPNKNNPENGLLFRRGFDYSTPYNTQKPSKENVKYQIDESPGYDEELYYQDWIAWVTNVGGGAEYVGQIVGPDGKVSQIQIKDWDTLTSVLDNNSGYGTSSTASVKDSPGWNGQNYNDTIKAGYANIVENGQVTGCWISFDIPYNVFTTTAQSVDPYGKETRSHYDQASEITDENLKINAEKIYEYDEQNDPNHEHPIFKGWKYSNLIHQHSRTGLNQYYIKTTDEDIDQNKQYYIKEQDEYILVENPIIDNINDYYQKQKQYHPFYHNFDIAIPQGIHGQEIEEIKVETATAGSTDFSHAKYSDVEDGDQYFTYSSRNYNQSAAGALTEHLGRWPYRVIDQINKEIQNHPDNSEQNYTIPNWTASTRKEEGNIVVINSDNNIFAVAQNSGNTGNQDPFNNENNVITIDNIGDTIQDNEVTWLVTNIPSTATAALERIKKLRISFTAGNDYTTTFKQIDQIWIDESGKMFIIYTDQPYIAYYLTQVNSINDIDQFDGGIIINYKNGQSVSFGIRQITDIFIDPDIRNDQNIYVNYIYNNTLSSSKLTNIPLNNILDVQREGDTFRILYSDPEKRNMIPEGKYVLRDYTIGSTTYPNLKWYKFGDLGAQYHVHGQLTYDDISITGQYAFGLDEGDSNLRNRQGWLISVQDYKEVEGQQIEIQRMFAYNYTKASTTGYHTIRANDGTEYQSNWYEITSLADAVTPANSHFVVSEDVDEDSSGVIYQDRETLKQDGLWFVVSRGHYHG